MLKIDWITDYVLINPQKINYFIVTKTCCRSIIFDFLEEKEIAQVYALVWNMNRAFESVVWGF